MRRIRGVYSKVKALHASRTYGNAFQEALGDFAGPNSGDLRTAHPIYTTCVPPGHLMCPLHHRWGRATHRRSTSSGRTVPSTVAAPASEPRASCCIAAGCPCPRCCDRGIVPRRTLVTGAVPATPILAAPARRPARTHAPAPPRGQKASKTRALHHDKCRSSRGQAG